MPSPNLPTTPAATRVHFVTSCWLCASVDSACAASVEASLSPVILYSSEYAVRAPCAPVAVSAKAVSSLPWLTRKSSVAPSSAIKAVVRPVTAAPAATADFFAKSCIALTLLFLNAMTCRVALIISFVILLFVFLAFFAALSNPPDMLSRRFRTVLMTLLFAIVCALLLLRECRSHARRRQQTHFLIIARPPDPQHRPVEDAHAPQLVRGDALHGIKRREVEERVARYEFFAVSSAV